MGLLELGRAVGPLVRGVDDGFIVGCTETVGSEVYEGRLDGEIDDGRRVG